MDISKNISKQFDLIIGNSKDCQIQKLDNSKKAEYATSGYQTFAPMGDLYCLYFEKAINSLKINGVLAIISSNQWLKNDYGRILRNYLLNYNPILLINLNTLFDDAKCLTIISNSENKNVTVGVNLLEKTDNYQSYINDNYVLMYSLTNNSWLIRDTKESRIAHKMEELGTPLRSWNISINRGVGTGFNDAFIISNGLKEKLCEEDQSSLDIINPLIKDKFISAFSYHWDGSWIISTYPAANIDIDNYPAVKNYLLSFGLERLVQTGETRNGIKARKKTSNEWYETQDNVAYYELFERDKIVYSQFQKQAEYAIAEPGYVITSSEYMITGNFNKYYFVSLLNSKLFNWYVKNNTHEVGNLKVAQKSNFIQLPIIRPDNFEQRDLFTKIVDVSRQICDCKKNEIDYTNLLNNVNSLVYKLYELTEDEIKIIEGEN